MVPMAADRRHSNATLTTGAGLLHQRNLTAFIASNSNNSSNNNNNAVVAVAVGNFAATAAPSSMTAAASSNTTPSSPLFPSGSNGTSPLTATVAGGGAGAGAGAGGSGNAGGGAFMGGLNFVNANGPYVPYKFDPLFVEDPLGKQPPVTYPSLPSHLHLTLSS